MSMNSGRIIVSGFYRYYLDLIGSKYSKNLSPVSLGFNIRTFEDKDWGYLSKLFYRCFGDEAHINQLKKYSVLFCSRVFSLFIMRKMKLWDTVDIICIEENSMVKRK